MVFTTALLIRTGTRGTYRGREDNLHLKAEYIDADWPPVLNVPLHSCGGPYTVFTNPVHLHVKPAPRSNDVEAGLSDQRAPAVRALKCPPHVNTWLAFRPRAGLPRRHSPQVPAPVCPILAFAPKRAFPLQATVLSQGLRRHVQGSCQLNLSERGFVSGLREGTT